jgi:hypothetical protein
MSARSPSLELPQVRTAVRIPMVAPPESLPDDDGLDELLARIAGDVRVRRPPGGMVTRIVAIDGLGGSGKSSFALQLSRALGGVAIV